MNTPFTYLLAFVAALAIGAGCNLDGPDDIAAEADQTNALTELQAAESGGERQRIAGLALCNEYKPGSVALWLQDGSLVCRAAPVAVAQGGVL